MTNKELLECADKLPTFKVEYLKLYEKCLLANKKVFLEKSSVSFYDIIQSINNSEHGLLLRQYQKTMEDIVNNCSISVNQYDTNLNAYFKLK